MSIQGSRYAPVAPPPQRGLGCAIFLLILANLQLLMITIPIVGLFLYRGKIESSVSAFVNKEKAPLEGEIKKLLQAEREKMQDDIKEIVRKERQRIEETFQRELDRSPRGKSGK